MNIEQKQVIKVNMEHVAAFLKDKTHRLLLNNHIVASSAGIDLREIKGEFPAMSNGKRFSIEFSFSVKAVPQQ